MPMLRTFDQVTGHLRDCLTRRDRWLLIADTGDGRRSLARLAVELWEEGLATPEPFVSLFDWVNSFTGIRHTLAFVSVEKAVVPTERVRRFVCEVSDARLGDDQDLVMVSDDDRTLPLFLAALELNRLAQKPPTGTN